MKIITKVQKGNFSSIMVIIPMLIVIPTIMVCLYIYIAQTTKEEIQDNLVTACLAAGIIDVENYGKNEEIIIANAEKSEKVFESCLKSNMRLDSSFLPLNTGVIYGKVTIDSLIFYNVYIDGHIEEYDAKSVGKEWKIIRTREESGSRDVFAPNGEKITETSIYVKISFPCKTIFSSYVFGRKQDGIDSIHGINNNNPNIENLVAVKKK